MKNLLFFTFLISLNFVFGQKQEGEDWDLIDHLNVGVFLINYPDQDSVTKSRFPSEFQVSEELFNPDSTIQKYFKDISYGKFSLTGEVIGTFTHQNGITADNDYQYEFNKTINTISVPGFDKSKYDVVMFYSLNDYVGSPGGLAGSGVFMVNGDTVKSTVILQAIQIGHYNRDLNSRISNGFTRKLTTTYFDENGEQSDYYSSNITQFERTTIHELIHTINVSTHADSRTNGDRYEFEQEVNDNEDFLKNGYGNVFCVMGNSNYGTSLNGGYRDLCGWTDSDNKEKIIDYGIQTVTLFPINRTSGKRILEVRIPYEFSDFSYAGYKNKGYFLEVRESDYWDAPLSKSGISENTEGFLILKTDGYTTELLDASPSSNFEFNWGRIPNYLDVALKPNMVYDDGEHVKFSNVVKNVDGSFSVDVEVYGETVSLEETIGALDIEIYPNPANSFIKIKGLNEKAMVRVFDVIGNVVYNQMYYLNERINLNHLIKGSYFIEVKNDEGLYKSSFLLK